MPTRARGHGHADGDGPEAHPSRPHGARPTVSSVRAAENEAAAVAHAGRPGGGGRTALGGSSRRPQTDHLITHRSGTTGGTPEGHPTKVEPDDDAPTRRSIEMETSAAVTLADDGWQVKQNPSPDDVARSRTDTGDTGNPDSKPDYLLEGRVFDCYSPTKADKSVRNIWSEVEDKVLVKEQTQRVVINLADWRGDMSALRKQFAEWPMAKLKEVKAITPDGEIVQIDLP